METIDIGGRVIGPGRPCLVVAEIGNNHDGSVGQAERLIEAAAEAGADAVKFQTHIAQAEMIRDGSPPSPHWPEDRYELTKRMELSLADHVRLKAKAEELGVLFFSTPFSHQAVDLLIEVGVPCLKVASGEVTNLPLVEYMARQGVPILLSTGMSSWIEIDAAVDRIRRHQESLILLQCTSAYPCAYDRVGLPALAEFQARYHCPVGLSDHSPTIEPSLAAVAVGACVIEKHFTLSRRLHGPDHRASLKPAEFSKLVNGIRRVTAALRPFPKDVVVPFQGVRRTFCKSVTSTCGIGRGVVISRSFLAARRPGTGLAPDMIDRIVGRRAACDIPADVLIRPEMIEGGI